MFCVMFSPPVLSKFTDYKVTAGRSGCVVQSEERWAFSPAQIGLLLRIWGHVSDTDGTISQRQLVKVVRSLLPPLGMGPDATNDAIVKMIGDMEVVPVFKHR